MIKLTVNGSEHALDLDPNMPLLWVIREHLGLTGTKYGCGLSQCGACTVHLNGAPVRACSTPLAAAAGGSVTTIEGLDSAAGKALEEAWAELDVVQCGFCLAAEKAGWGEEPLSEVPARGVAVHEPFNSYVAQVAEVTVRAGGAFSVDRVVIAVDCGIAVNPDVIVAQMEAGMGFGLSATLMSEATLKDDLVQQSNFHDDQVLRMDRMRKQVEVHIVPSAEPPTGVGEPATPVIAPAVADALAAATGQRLRQLPLRLA